MNRLWSLLLVIMLALDRLAIRSEYSRLSVGSMATAEPPKSKAIGGGFADGLKAVFTSPYLLGIAGFIMLMAISNTLIYFTQANVILDSTDTFSQRVEGFAQFDMLAQIATLFTQVFITTQIIKRLGVGWTLTILPLVTVAGFAVLAIWPVFGVMAIFQAVHRATRYAVTRPARETLFSVVPAADKYKAKPLIDAGMRWAPTPREAAAESEVIFSILTDGAAVDHQHPTTLALQQSGRLQPDRSGPDHQDVGRRRMRHRASSFHGGCGRFRNIDGESTRA